MKLKILFSILILLGSHFLFSQKGNEALKDSSILSIQQDSVIEEEMFISLNETLPRFPGCEDKGLAEKELYKCSEEELLKFIYSNLKYPEKARENNITGRVIAQFVILEDGSVAEIKILKSLGGGCEKEVTRVLNLMNQMPQKWTPGSSRGKPTKVTFTIPISFPFS